MAVNTTAHAAQEGQHTIVPWFRNDLRLHDSAILHEAARRLDKANSQAQVVPVFCYDPRLFGTTRWGNPKTGPSRLKFLLESVEALRMALLGIGSDLLTTHSNPEQSMSELLAESAAGTQFTVLTQQEVTPEECNDEAAVEALLERHGAGRLVRLWGTTLLHRDDWPFDAAAADLPDSFTKFSSTDCRKKVEQPEHWRVHDELPVPAAGSLPLPQGGLPAIPSAFRPHSPAALADLTASVAALSIKTAAPCDKALLHFEGGEEAGLRRLQQYIWQSNAVAHYAETRNGLLEANDSTKLAAWLALGCVSPRRVYHEVRRYEAERVANDSTRMVLFHLLVRDWFRLFCQKHGHRVFLKHGITGERRKWRDRSAAFDRWHNGTTGIPFVDAHMRELHQTGYMSNRGRQNVASYLAHDLGLDWRRGADWFESRLLDYDVCSNWGNWVSAAGLAPGRCSRFHVVKQGISYHPDGRYIQKWVPELANVPPEHIHQPWRMSRAEQEACGVQLPEDYPLPISGTQYDEAD